MPTYRLATTVWTDSLLPRDGMMINPILNTVNPAADLQSLVDDWDTALQSWLYPANAQRQVKLYTVGDGPQGPPKAEKISHVGTTSTMGVPPELACCLSFFAGQNVKRKRGRLYVPLAWIGSGGATRRPSTTIQEKVGSLAAILADLGGIDIDWSVYSGVDKQARSVSEWWVDDEWDIQRRRGGKPTSRTAGTVSE